MLQRHSSQSASCAASRMGARPSLDGAVPTSPKMSFAFPWAVLPAARPSSRCSLRLQPLAPAQQMLTRSRGRPARYSKVCKGRVTLVGTTICSFGHSSACLPSQTRSRASRCHAFSANIAFRPSCDALPRAAWCAWRRVPQGVASAVSSLNACSTRREIIAILSSFNVSARFDNRS